MNILIVDDEAAPRLFLTEILETAGHTVVDAESVREALMVLDEQTPDLILCDLEMPEEDGLQLLRDVRSTDSEIFFVLLAYPGSEGAAIKALEERANNYLLKPVRHEVLMSLLDKYHQLVTERRSPRRMRGKLTSRSFKLECESRLEHLLGVADLLVSEAGDAIPERERHGVHLGLYELLVNAVEHGNLGIGFEEKGLALESMDGYTRLVQSRLGKRDLARRKVRVEFLLDQERCEWTIVDEGEGFNWRALPNPLDGNPHDRLNGRGIFLARFQFDEVSYIGRGNRVRAVKFRAETSPATQDAAEAEIG